MRPTRTNEILYAHALEILDDCNKRSIEIRFLGSVALLFLDPSKITWLNENRRPIADIDLIVSKTNVDSLEYYFTERGYINDRNIKMLHGNKRRNFYSPENISIDVFIDNIYLCQEIKVSDRLHLNFPTITNSDLFLSKIQKQNLTDLDVFDIYYILNYNIDTDYIINLALNNWRWWKTLQTNLPIVINSNINITTKALLIDILHSIIKGRKSIKWKIRGFLGPGFQWYNVVEG